MVVALILLVGLSLVLGNIGLAVWGLLKLNGWSRALSGLPLVLVAAVAVRVCLEVARDPTSHNLWPFEMALASAVGLGISLSAWGLSRLFSQSQG